MKKITNYLSIVALLCGLGSCSKSDNPTQEQPKKEETADLDQNVPAIIPHVFIDIENNQEVVVKDTYLNAKVSINGNKVNTDLAEVSTRIKGRGNSTWGKPKKPYRLKLDKEASVLGLPAAKDWVLLANYQDYSFMCNAIAMKIGQQLSMPFTNTMIPVDVTINGEYRGNYMLTQQIEVKQNRVNVGDEGYLIEFDTNYDEDWQFKSANFDLPIMIKSPDIESDEQFNVIKNEIQSLESLVFSSQFPNNDYGKVFDKQQLVNYFIVNTLTGNRELTHPKSVYMHKSKTGKFTMGPIWDFDWGFGFNEENRKYFGFTEIALLVDGDQRSGAKFFSKLLTDPEIKQLYKTTWTSYKNNQFQSLLDYVEEYAARIRESQQKDFAIWKVGESNLGETKKSMKNYLKKRAEYMDSFVSKF